MIACAAISVSCAAAPADARAIAGTTTADSDDDPYGDVSTALASTAGEDATFANLFSSWKRMDGGAAESPAVRTGAYVPSGRPVEKLDLTSNFGVRSDPFNGSARMHKGIDIPGPIGTPIYATADGIVSRSGWASGYGNLIEISHGNELSTRYGHMSKLLVEPNTRVRKGQLIGLMGSTGRSTGSHLHYEVRIAGTAVNPLPYVIGSERALALNTQPPVAVGGPAKGD